MDGLTIEVTSVTITTPDPRALAAFYSRLLGRQWTPPPGPSEPAAQHATQHLDIKVSDLPTATAHAQACGATLAPFQPQQDVRVLFDPSGHPFCLYT
jgi:hypothetical protein